MNWLDYVLIALLALSAFQSFRRGFTREIIGLCSTLAALVLGMWFYGTAASLVRPHVSSDRAANFAGFLLIFVSVLVIGAIVGWIVRRFVKAIGLSFFDRLLGAAFGLIRGALIAIALLTAYIAFGSHINSKSEPGAVVNSQIAPYLLEASRIFADAAPAELKQSFRDAYSQVKIEIREMAQSKDAGKK